MEVERYLKENYLIKTKKELASATGLTYYQVEYYLRKLKLTKYKNKLWTDEEDAIMKQYYKSPVPYELLYKLLPDRTYTSICKRAQTLGLNKDLYERSKRIYHDKQYGYVFYRPARNKNNPTKIALHRKIWIATYGEIPEGYIVHHIDGNKLNNDIKNLCLMTRSEHMKHHWNGIVKTRLKVKI